jgi:hypothetical protein
MRDLLGIVCAAYPLISARMWGWSMANESSVWELGPSHSAIGYVWVSGSIAERDSDLERFAIRIPYKPDRSNT